MRLQSALWAGSSPAYKDSLGCSPFRLVYGLEVVVSAEFIVPSVHIAVKKERLDEHESVLSKERNSPSA